MIRQVWIESKQEAIFVYNGIINDIDLILTDAINTTFLLNKDVFLAFLVE